MVLTLAMLIGGPSTSTTGGLKLHRFLIIVKATLLSAMNWFYQTDKAKEESFYKELHKKQLPSRLYRNTVGFVFIWIALYLFIFYILLHFVPEKYGPMEVAFECASAMGTTGLSVGIVGHEMHTVAKLDIMVAMLIGRLELIPVALLFTAAVRKYFELKHP